MLSRTELDQIRSRMEQEHRLDIDALERIMRFLPAEAQYVRHEPTVSSTTSNGHDPNFSVLASDENTILGAIETILVERCNRTWTVPQIRDELVMRGHALTAKNPQATISVAVKKLYDRNKVKLVRSGSGRQPHIWQWQQTSIADCEVLEDEVDS